MRFWDASALLPLLGPERDTARRETLLQSDAAITVWWGTHTACAAALARKARSGEASDSAIALARQLLADLTESWMEITPTTGVRATADRLLQVHPLRSADSLQLAAALIACEHDPTRLPFVCADKRLAEAARKEGFVVVA